ncbi:4-hydroxyphenylacetate 3-monooxygenase, partial [Enterobacter intestinihominis]
VLKGAMAILAGELTQEQTIATHLVYLVENNYIIIRSERYGLIYFKRRFHRVLLEMEAAV